jgi:hypothetical protein
MLPSSSRTRVALLAATAFSVLGIACPLAARADDQSPDAGAARLSYAQGPVAVQRGDANSPNNAVLNAPIMGADYLTTGEGARAEVQFDAASMIRLGSNVQMRFTRLDPDTRTLQLAQGTIELRYLRRYDGNAEVDTPSIGVRPREAGIYRVTVAPDGETLVTVRSGAADVLTSQGDQPLETGSTLVARGDSSAPSMRSVAEIAPDAFDRFNADRDQRAEVALDRTASYVSPSVPGVDDLNQYGQWVDDPNYGEVWAPSNVAADWAPYRDGSWTWEDGYGWTWIGYEPWGWAPYHYGRWFHGARGWCWDPPRGPFLAEPWRPALVAFIGFGGPGVSVGLGFGNVGWVPLAPSEPFYPWWGGAYENNIAINVNVYHNARYGGVTAVPGRRFLLGRFDHPVAVRTAQLGDAHAMRGALPIVPTQANLRFGERSAPRQLTLRTPFTERSFAGTGVVVRRTPFEQQRSAIAAATHLSAPRYVPAANGFARPQADRPAIQRSTPAGPWSRFDQARGFTPTSRGYVAPENRGYAGPQNRGYAAPQNRGYVAPEHRGYSTPQNRGYVAPENRGYSAPQNRGYSTPQNRGYMPPENRNYPPPQNRSYAAPPQNRGYAPPENHGNAPPARSYQAPSRQEAPHQSAPSRPAPPPHNDHSHH